MQYPCHLDKIEKMALLTLYSEVSNEERKRALLICTLLSGSGGLLLLYFGAFSPEGFLKEWGALIYLFSLFLIMLGFLPYRRVRSADALPRTLKLTERGEVLYSSGKGEVKVELSEVASISFASGILIKTKKGKSLFFPFFSYESYTKLKRAVAQEEALPF